MLARVLAYLGITLDEIEPCAEGDAVYLAMRQAYAKAHALEAETAATWRRFHTLQATLAQRVVSADLAAKAEDHSHNLREFRAPRQLGRGASAGALYRKPINAYRARALCGPPYFGR